MLSKYRVNAYSWVVSKDHSVSSSCTLCQPVLIYSKCIPLLVHTLHSIPSSCTLLCQPVLILGLSDKVENWYVLKVLNKLDCICT